MNVFLLIMPLVSGYWFLSFWNRTKFKVYTKSGYRVFLESAFVGIVLLFIAKFAISIILALPVIQLDNLINVGLKWIIPTGFNSEGTLALVIGLALPFILNCFTDERKFKRHAAEERGGQLYVKICKAMDESRLVELTIQSRKV